MFSKFKTLFKGKLLKHVVGRSLKRDAPYRQQRVRSILVFRFDRIGDMVVTTPFLRSLKQTLPHASIDVLCSRINAGILRWNPSIANALVLQSGLRGIVQLYKFRNQYDLVIDLNHSVIWRDMLMIRFVNPVWAASVTKDGRYGIKGSDIHLYRVMPPDASLRDKRIAYTYLNLIKAFGATPPSEISYEMYVSPAEQSQTLSRNNLSTEQGYWLVNQHGGRVQMRLNDVDVRDVIKLLLRVDPTSRVLWASSPSTYAEIKRYVDKFFQNEGRLQIYEPTDDVLDMVPIVKNAKGLVSPDTSLIHIAAAFSKPSVIVFTAEQALYEQWQPPCNAWSRHIFSKNKKSLDGYSADELLKATELLIEAVGKAR